MRIVQIAETLEVGGLEKFAIDLAREQRRVGHEPYLYCLARGGPLADEAQREGIPVRIFHKTSGWSPRLLVRLTRQLRRDAPDVVHTHNPGTHPYGALAARLAGVPVVINTRHGVSTSSGNVHRERYFRATMFLTGQVVFVSDHSRRFLVEDRGLPSAKARVILNGIALGAYGEPATPDSARPRIRFGTIGRLVPVKAHLILIEAFATLLERVPDAELTIAGHGPLFGEIQSRIRQLGIAAHVTLVGEIRDVPAMLRKCDIFVFSSISEGLPIVILEAMAAGLPIVSTRVGGVPEVAPEGQVAWYCEPGSAKDLAEAMYLAATSGECANRGRTAREIAHQRYGIAQTQQAYEAVYRELLEVGG